MVITDREINLIPKIIQIEREAMKESRLKALATIIESQEKLDDTSKKMFKELLDTLAEKSEEIWMPAVGSLYHYITFEKGALVRRVERWDGCPMDILRYNGGLVFSCPNAAFDVIERLNAVLLH